MHSVNIQKVDRIVNDCYGVIQCTPKRWDCISACEMSSRTVSQSLGHLLLRRHSQQVTVDGAIGLGIAAGAVVMAGVALKYLMSSRSRN